MSQKIWVGVWHSQAPAGKLSVWGELKKTTVTSSGTRHAVNRVLKEVLALPKEARAYHANNQDKTIPVGSRIVIRVERVA